MATRQIEMVKIRAKISIGTLSVETPFIQSFNVSKTRGQSSTFSASIKIHGDDNSSLVGDQVEIYAGTKLGITKIFSGMVKKASITPCWDDPSYVIINMTGTDVLSLLEGKQFTRRCKATKASWVTIQSVARRGLKSGKFKYKKEDVLMMTSAGIEESTELVKTIAPVMSNVDSLSKNTERPKIVPIKISLNQNVNDQT